MTSITTYTPFTYCITFLPTGKRYYGSRYANNKSIVAHPSQLWTTYFTSSETIKTLIEEHGKESFAFEVRKTFKTRTEALTWENKFLTRIQAAQSPEWLNGNNGSSTFHSTPESIQKQKDTKKRNGTAHNMKNPETVQKAMETRKRNGTLNPNTPESIQKQKDTKKLRGIESPMKNPDTVQKMLDTRKRNGTLNPNTPESIQKRKETMRKNGTTTFTAESIQKRKETMRKNGTTSAHTPETVQKVKDTKKLRGIENPSSTPFLSMLHNKKTYAKNIITRCYPELKIFY